VKTAIEDALAAIVAQSSLPQGFQFSAYQKSSFARLLMGHDLLVSLRTGGGKFLIGALSSLFCNGGTLFLLTPLDMLAIEHYQSMVKCGIPTNRIVVLNSSNIDTVVQQVNDVKQHGEAFYVIGHPEYFLQLNRRKAYNTKHCSVSVVVVDELQLVKEWGIGGFRVAWKKIQELLRHHDKIRFVGLSGSAKPALRTELCGIVGIHRQSILVGDMSRWDLKHTVVEEYGNLPRTTNTWKSGTAKIHQMEQILLLLDNDTDGRGVIVWVQSCEGCDKYCNDLNEFFAARKEAGSGTAVRRHAAYTYYNNNSTHSLKAVIDFFGNKDHPCDVMVGTIALMYGLNFPPVAGVFSIGCTAGISPQWQLVGRSNRGFGVSTIGRTFLFFNYKKYRDDVVREIKNLSFEYENIDGAHAAAVEAVKDLQEIYKMALDNRLCLQLYYDEYFGGSQIHKRCQRGNEAACSICERRWTVENLRVAAKSMTDANQHNKAIKKTLPRQCTRPIPHRPTSMFPPPRSLWLKEGDPTIKWLVLHMERILSNRQI